MGDCAMLEILVGFLCRDLAVRVCIAFTRRGDVDDAPHVRLILHVVSCTATSEPVSNDADGQAVLPENFVEG